MEVSVRSAPPSSPLIPLVRGLAALAVAVPLALSTPAAAADLEAIPLDDPDFYEARWTWLHNGPPGCWEVVGRADWRWDAGRFGASTGNAVFVGRLEEGLWTDMEIRSLGEEVEEWGHVPVRQYGHGKLRFVPMVGRLGPRITHGRIEDDGDGLLESLLDELGGAVIASSVDWDEVKEGVVLTRQVPVGVEGRSVPAPVKVFFPGGGELPSRLDVVVDDPFTIPGGRGARVRSADAHIRGRLFGGMVFPEAESLKFEATYLGFSFYGAQTVRYESVRPCGLPATVETRPLGG